MENQYFLDGGRKIKLYGHDQREVNFDKKNQYGLLDRTDEILEKF
jgi:hypothetical protein